MKYHVRYSAVYHGEEFIAECVTVSAAQRLAERLNAISDLESACNLALTWLSNSTPVVEMEGPKPMPVICAALARAKSTPA